MFNFLKWLIKLSFLIQIILSIKAYDGSTNNTINDGARTPLVVGGEEVKPEFKYPFVASLQWKRNHVCGGTLIRPNVVLTAAHCSTGNQGDFTVIIHRHNLSKSLMDENGQAFKVLKRIIHESYSTMTNFYDAALWKLDGSYKGEFIQVNLDEGEGSMPGNNVIGIGWGRLKVDGPLSKVLMEVEVPLTDNKLCIDIMKEQGYTISPDIQICAGLPEGGKDTCQGDSGGPLISNKDGKISLVGITSFGISCALPNLPGIYTKVKGIKEWILTKLKELEEKNEIDLNNEDIINTLDFNFKKNTKENLKTPVIINNNNNNNNNNNQDKKEILKILNSNLNKLHSPEKIKDSKAINWIPSINNDI